MLRWLAIGLMLLLLLLQIKLWQEYAEVASLRDQVELHAEQNRQLAERNAALAAEVENLKAGMEAIEERARTELGLIKPGETFIQVVEEDDQ